MKVLLLNGSRRRTAILPLLCMKWWIFSTKKALKRKLFMSAIKTSEDVWHAGNVLSWALRFLTILSTKLRRNLRKRTVSCRRQSIVLCLRKRNTCRAFDAPVLQHSIR